MDIHEDRAGNLWFATNHGLFRLQNNLVTQFTTIEGLPSNKAKVIRAKSCETPWLTLTDQNGAARTVLTGIKDNFQFTDVPAGQTVIVSVVSKRYKFQAQIVNVTEELGGLNFTANP